MHFCFYFKDQLAFLLKTIKDGKKTTNPTKISVYCRKISKNVLFEFKIQTGIKLENLQKVVYHRKISGLPLVCSGLPIVFDRFTGFNFLIFNCRTDRFLVVQGLDNLGLHTRPRPKPTPWATNHATKPSLAHTMGSMSLNFLQFNLFSKKYFYTPKRFILVF